MNGLARTACWRCREQKLRCSRELPKCARCLRLGAICGFPSPPDRKMLAARRAHPKRRPTEHSPEPPTDNNPQHHSVGPSNDIATVGEEAPVADDHELPSSVQEFLQEVYFTCMFNAALVFHRPTFSLAFNERSLPRHVLLAVYASATIFLRPSSALAWRNAGLLRPLGDLAALGREWAIRAGREVLQGIDQPSFESVQTCEMLSLYWFAAGESQRNTMFSGVAYKAACTLGLDLRDSDDSSKISTSTMMTAPPRLRAETMRRCFWAVWFTQCINSDHRRIGTSYDDSVMDLPLPIGEEAFIQGVHPPPMALCTSLNQDPGSTSDEQANPSIMAELMMLVLHWAKIRDLVRKIDRVPVKHWLSDMFEVDGSLSSWSGRLPHSFEYSKRNLYEQLVVHQQPVYIFVHALYHQCRLVLHSSLVPHFSGVRLRESVPSEATSLCARVSIKSAQALSQLGADLLALDWEPAQIAVFVGYCMYAAATIHITLLHCKDAALAAHARASLLSNLKLLKSMKSYGANLERLWGRVTLLYGVQMSRHCQWSGRDNIGTMDLQRHLGDLDQIAGEPRDTGELSEPLANSVLEYTLRRLNPNAQAHTEAIREPENHVYTAIVNQLMGDDSPTLPAECGVPTAGPDRRSYPAADSLHEMEPTLAPVTVLETWTRTSPMLPTQANSYEWWQFNLDDIEQPVLPYASTGFDFNVCDL